MDQQLVDRLLKERQTVLIFQHLANRLTVQDAISLGAGGPDCGSFS